MRKKEGSKWKFLSIKGFIDENKFSWWVMGIFLLITYGIKVFNVSISHDTEAIISAPDFLYGSWYELGRFGLIFLKKILGTYIFNPFAASLLMFVTMVLNGIIWEYLFCWLGRTENAKSRAAYIWIFPAVFFTSMIMAEQSGFLLQAYEVNVALLMLALALLNLYKLFLDGGGWYQCIPAIVCCIVAFSTYQSFVPLFTAGAAMCFMIVYDRMASREKGSITFIFCWKLIGMLIAVFLISFILYQGLNMMILTGMGKKTTSYLTDQILWGTVPVKECIHNILKHVYDVFRGTSIFYPLTYLVVYIAAVLYLIIRIGEKKACYLMYFLAGGFVLLSPFLMTILMGSTPAARTEILLPFVAGFFFQYLTEYLADKRGGVGHACSTAAIVAIVCFTMHQSLFAAKLYYTQYVQYEEDVRLAVKITDRIDQLNLGEYPQEPVVFVGRRIPQKNAAVFEDQDLELIGRSFFEVCFSSEHGTWVLNHFLDTLGYSYVMPDKEQIAVADKEAADMPVWPDVGSVAVKDGVIIVKLGQ